jgi:hypothetical protein
MQVENNTIVLVRALVKLSSALYDVDDMKEMSKHKYQMKIDINEFQEWLELYITDSMSKLSNSDPELLLELIKMYNGYDETVYIRTPYFTKVNLFLAKLYSALRDLKKLDKIHSEYVIELSTKIEELLDNKYFKSYINYTSVENRTFWDLVGFMDDKGNSVIIGTL